METNVGNEKRELRIEYFRETGLNAMKSNFTYMNWLEERHIKQLALFNVKQRSELFEIISDRLLNELGAELSRMTKEDLIKIISKG